MDPIKLVREMKETEAPKEGKVPEETPKEDPPQGEKTKDHIEILKDIDENFQFRCHIGYYIEKYASFLKDFESCLKDRVDLGDLSDPSNLRDLRNLKKQLKNYFKSIPKKAFEEIDVDEYGCCSRIEYGVLSLSEIIDDFCDDDHTWTIGDFFYSLVRFLEKLVEYKETNNIEEQTDNGENQSDNEGTSSEEDTDEETEGTSSEEETDDVPDKVSDDVSEMDDSSCDSSDCGTTDSEEYAEEEDDSYDEFILINIKHKRKVLRNLDEFKRHLAGCIYNIIKYTKRVTSAVLNTGTCLDDSEKLIESIPRKAFEDVPPGYNSEDGHINDTTLSIFRAVKSTHDHNRPWSIGWYMGQITDYIERLLEKYKELKDEGFEEEEEEEEEYDHLEALLERIHSYKNKKNV